MLEGLALEVMQQKFEVDDATVFASASAGAFPAFLLATGVDAEEFHNGPNRKLIESIEVRTSVARPVTSTTPRVVASSASASASPVSPASASPASSASAASPSVSSSFFCLSS